MYKLSLNSNREACESGIFYWKSNIDLFPKVAGIREDRTAVTGRRTAFGIFYGRRETWQSRSGNGQKGQESGGSSQIIGESGKPRRSARTNSLQEKRQRTSRQG